MKKPKPASKPVANFTDTPFDKKQNSVKGEGSKEENYVRFSYSRDFSGTIMHFNLHNFNSKFRDTSIIMHLITYMLTLTS